MNELYQRYEYRYLWPVFKKDKFGEVPYGEFTDKEVNDKIVEVMPQIYYFKDDKKKTYYQYRNGRFHLFEKKVLERPEDPNVEWYNEAVATSDEYDSKDLMPPHEYYSRNYNRTENSLIPHSIGAFLDGLRDLERNNELDDRTKDELRMYMENSFIRTIKKEKTEFAGFTEKDIPENIDYGQPYEYDPQYSGLPKSRLWKMLGPKFTKIAYRHLNTSPTEQLSLEMPKTRDLPENERAIYNTAKYAFFEKQKKSEYEKFYQPTEYFVNDVEEEYSSGEKSQDKEDELNNITPEFNSFRSRILSSPNRSIFGFFSPSPVLLKKRFDIFNNLDVLLPSEDEKYYNEFVGDDIKMNTHPAANTIIEQLMKAEVPLSRMKDILQTLPEYKHKKLTDKDVNEIIYGVNEKYYKYNPYAVPKDSQGIKKIPDGIDPALFRSITLFQTRHKHRIYDSDASDNDKKNEFKDDKNPNLFNDKESNKKESNKKESNKKESKKRKTIEDFEVLSEDTSDISPDENIEDKLDGIFNWNKEREPKSYIKVMRDTPNNITGVFIYIFSNLVLYHLY